MTCDRHPVAMYEIVVLSESEQCHHQRGKLQMVLSIAVHARHTLTFNLVRQRWDSVAYVEGVHKFLGSTTSGFIKQLNIYTKNRFLVRVGT